MAQTQEAFQWKLLGFLVCNFYVSLTSLPRLTRRGLPPSVEDALAVFAFFRASQNCPTLVVASRPLKKSPAVKVIKQKAGHFPLGLDQISRVPTCQDVTVHREHRVIGDFLKRLGAKESWGKIFLAEILPK